MPECARRCILVLCLALPASGALAQDPPPAQSPSPESSASEREGGVGRALLLWLPNRVFDLLDVVRLRARVGPGVSASVRATEAVDAALGGHVALWVGLPGPRGEPRVSLPIGVETYAGLEVSLLEAGSEDDRHGPRYGPFEIGAGAQVVLVGLDLGVEPVEALDFLAGIVFLDLKKDDL